MGTEAGAVERPAAPAPASGSPRGPLAARQLSVPGAHCSPGPCRAGNELCSVGSRDEGDEAAPGSPSSAKGLGKPPTSLLSPQGLFLEMGQWQEGSSTRFLTSC